MHHQLSCSLLSSYSISESNADHVTFLTGVLYCTLSGYDFSGNVERPNPGLVSSYSGHSHDEMRWRAKKLRLA